MCHSVSKNAQWSIIIVYVFKYTDTLAERTTGKNVNHMQKKNGRNILKLVFLY